MFWVFVGGGLFVFLILGGSCSFSRVLLGELLDNGGSGLFVLLVVGDVVVVSIEIFGVRCVLFDKVVFVICVV